MEKEWFEKKVKGDIAWDEASSVTKISPALDFAGRAYTTVYLDVKKSDGIRTSPMLVTSDRKLIEFNTEFFKDEGISLSALPMKLSGTRWSKQSLKNFLQGIYEEPSWERIYNEIKDKLKFYFDFEDERTYSFISLWIMGTYFFPIFNSYPYLFVFGTKRCGKTKLLTFLSMLCFNAVQALGMTSASLFRMIQNNRSTILIDETDRVVKRESSDLRSILLSGYKKGSVVPRTREYTRKGSKYYTVDTFECYSPKAMANIRGMEDVMEDRAITIIMQRSSQIVASRELFASASFWGEIRDMLYNLMMVEWKELKKRYFLLVKIMERDLSLPIISTSPQEKVVEGRDKSPCTILEGKNISTNSTKSIYRNQKNENIPTKVKSGRDKDREGEVVYLYAKGRVGRVGRVGSIHKHKVYKENKNTISNKENATFRKTYPISTFPTKSIYRSPSKGQKKPILQGYSPLPSPLNTTSPNPCFLNDGGTGLVEMKVEKTGRDKISVPPKKYFFEKILESGLKTRNLELSLPILTVASLVNKKVFEETIDYLKKSVKLKEMEEVTELVELELLRILIEEVDKVDYYKIKTFASLLLERREQKWISSRWVSRSLRRFGLVKEKRVVHGLTEVLLDPKIISQKAQDYGINVEEVLKEKGIIRARNKRDKLLIIIKNNAKFFGGDVPRDDIVVLAEKEGMLKEKVEEMIDKMLQEGVLCERKPGHLTVV